MGGRNSGNLGSIRKKTALGQKKERSFFDGRMQDKRRRDDFASTEVGEVKGGRVTQQAFEVADKKDSGISDAAMPGTRGDGRKDAQENARL